jgi:transglutaminase-like putative cysteine protease
MKITDEDIKRLTIWMGAGLLVRLLWSRSAFNFSEENPHRHTNAITYSHTKLAAGTPGVEETLRQMARLVRYSAVDPRVRDFAINLVRDCRGHDFECEIRTCFEYVQRRITYRRDPASDERVQDARRTIFNFGTGDCDDKVVVLASLLAVLGHKSRFVVCGFHSDDYSHVYLQVFISGQGWVSLDPTSETAAIGWQADAPFTATFQIFD